MGQAAIKPVNDSAADKFAVGAGAPARIRFKKLSLTDFRSYERIEIALDGRPATFAGPNGAGKTNLLEAISLLGPGRGLRNAKLGELPRIEGEGGWAVSARLDDGVGGDCRLGVGATITAPDRRVCRIDESAASGPSAFSDHLRLLWLTPAQDRLFMEGASERRRFIDRMALAHDCGHGRTASAYEQSMRQRQRLLDERSRDNVWLDALEAQMAQAAVAIAAGRRNIAGTLAAAEVALNEDSAFPAADIALEGSLEAALEHGPAAEVEEGFIRALRDGRRRDAEAGRALDGPHRSDLQVTHRATGRAARLCSTGEQKALLIGLVLANARALAMRRAVDGSERGAPLFLLLDEIAAHLDETRRGALFDILDQTGFQSFMTGTDQSLFAAWGARAQHFNVADNTVRES